MPPFEARRAALWLALALGLAGVIFTVWPGIDLWFSGLFHDPSAGFWLAGNVALEFWRDMAWNLSIALFLASLAGLVAALFGKALPGAGGRVWGFIAALYLLGPILLVDRLLKEHWGRARPANVEAFGGAEGFTPALIPSGQCVSNCSFVSGEGSAAVTLGICMVALRPAVARRLPYVGVEAWTFAAYFIPFATLLQRIATGRHFLSDSVFATLFMLALALLLRQVILAPGRRR